MGLHLLAVAGIVLGSQLQDAPADEPPVRVTFLQFGSLPDAGGPMTAPGPERDGPVEPVTVPAAAPPMVSEKHPAAPDQLDDALLEAAVEEPVVAEANSMNSAAGPQEILQPQEVPERIHTGPVPGPPAGAAVAEAEGGLPGGVAGGIPGGIPGGIVGGQPLPPGPFRAGGGITAPLPIRRVQPDYPARAQRARVEGQVTLEAVIRKDGTVGEVRVVRGLRMGCTDAAIEALKQWRFRPGERLGVPVDVYFELTVDFVLG